MRPHSGIGCIVGFPVCGMHRVGSPRGVRLFRVGSAKIKIRKGVLSGKFAVHPGINPDEDGDGQGGEQGQEKQPVRGWIASNGSDQGGEIHENQQGNADQRHDLPRPAWR